MPECPTLGEAIRRNAELRPELSAIVASDLIPLSYEELREYIDGLFADLRRAGFDCNARIAVGLQSGPEAALAIMAISCSAVAVPLDLKLALPEIEKRLALLRPAAIVLLRDSPSIARTAAERQGLPVIEAFVPSKRKLGLRLQIPQTGPAAGLEGPVLDTPAFILQTSGTTGEPKLIPYSHRNMLAAAARVQRWFELTPSDRCLSVSPIYYSHGIKLTFFTPLLTGGSIAYPSDASKLDVHEWLGALRPTWYSAGPTLHRFMLEKTKLVPEVKSIHTLRFIVSGGAPLPIDILEGLQAELGVPVLEHYGSSEAGQIAGNLPRAGMAKSGTCGILQPDIAAIVGEDGKRLPPREEGELVVRGPTVMSGYIDAPEGNEAAFVDGWFRTGDLASVDEDGFLTLHGRKQELINRGGEKIAPMEIDKALMRHPAVVEAAAYAVPHPRLGQDIAAAVVLRPGFSITAEKLREFLSSQLAWFKIPRRIEFRDQLPKGVTGKVQRQRLGERPQ